MLERAELFDGELVARLTRREIAGPPSPFPHRGIHQSPHRGASLEFSEHVEYSPGDDLKHLDWKVFAKSDRYFVKRYEDERLQRVVFLVDASASMGYGAQPGGLRGSKYHLGARAVVALAACLLHQGDAVGLAVAGEREAWLLPRTGARQLEAVIELLGRVEPGGRARFSEACGAAAERLGKGAAVFAVSDYLDEGEEDLPGPRFLKARGLSPRTIQVLHADEVDLPFENTTRFVDLEGPGSLVLDPEALRRAYREELGAFLQRLSAGAALLGVPHALVTTADDPGPPLVRLLHSLGKR